MTLICWLRRDLRLKDNPALAFAARAAQGRVIPVFVFDPAILGDGFVGPAIVAATLEMLANLDAALRSLGSQLVIRHGEPLAELLKLAEESNADGIVWNRDYTPFAVRRDQAVKAAFKARGLSARSFHDTALVEPEGLLKPGGREPYTLFTPYLRRWTELAYAQAERDEPAPEALAPLPENLQPGQLPTLADLGFSLDQQLPEASEAAAHELLRRFTDRRRSANIVTYAKARDLPALAATSGLSMHLRMGTISVRDCLRAALATLEAPLTTQERSGPDTWLSELAWRDFYQQLVFHAPHMLKGPFDARFERLEWHDDPAGLRAWQTGQTGYPLVDAGQRELRATAWMHNRVRMVSASFLAKHLLINWQEGERWFMRQLRDGDPPSNNGGWQWAAGTGGPSAQPYFRILNPVAQSQRFDRDGAYIRRFVPELAEVPAALIHEPWRMTPEQQRRYNCRIGSDYPAPIVEHSAARDRALATYRQALGKDQ